MEDINKIFRAALKHFILARGDQARLADKTGVSRPFLNDILQGRSKGGGSDATRRVLSAALGFPGPRHEHFLNIGRAILAGQPIPAEPPTDYVSEAELAGAGCFQVPLDWADRLEAGGSRAPRSVKPENTAHIVVHGPTLGRKNGRGLWAFVVEGDNMEPLLARGGLVVADLTKNRAENLKEGAAYVISYDEERAGAVKYLRWVEKGRVLSLESENKSYQAVFRKAREVILIGQVIWSCRAHK
ncbi:MAG: S24 family peptidase [Candidatus Adiutrix sp.]|nr:S24 family peptidase [Candidatus Adiutrix sp.]